MNKCGDGNVCKHDNFWYNKSISKLYIRLVDTRASESYEVHCVHCFPSWKRNKICLLYMASINCLVALALFQVDLELVSRLPCYNFAPSGHLTCHNTINYFRIVCFVHGCNRVTAFRLESPFQILKFDPSKFKWNILSPSRSESE